MSAISSEPRRISMVIPTWNGGPRFRTVLEALASQDIEGGFELLVIDSGSTDGTPELARSAGARVESIPQREFNHGRTRNVGIAATKGAVIALLTQDAVPMGDNFLRNLVKPLEDAEVDGSYARQFPRPDCDPILAERLQQWSAARDTPVLQAFVLGDPAGSRTAFDERQPLERYLTCAFDNVASAVRRKSWERQPLPERKFGEDVAWARSVLLEGGCVAFEPSASVEHSHRISMRREFKRLYCDHSNLSELFSLRNVPDWQRVRSGWRGQVEVYARLLESQPLGSLERLYWRAYSMPYAFLEGMAQFLGARSPWKTQESAFWRWFDVRMRKGV